MISEMGNSTVFAAISNKEKRKFKKNYRKQLEVANIPFGPMGRYGRMEEANAKLEEKKRELSRQIELSLGFGELREKLDNSEEDKIWGAHAEERRHGKLEISYPQFLEKQKMKMIWAAIPNDFGNCGDPITLPEQQWASTEEKALGNVEPRWSEDVIMWILKK